MSTSCPATPAPRQPTGSVLTIFISPTLGTKSLAFGEPNTSASGETVTPLNLRFYVSDVALLSGADDSTPTDIVTAAGAVEAYGIHLFNAERIDWQTLRV